MPTNLRRDPKTGRFLPRVTPQPAPWSVIAIGIEPIDPFGLGPDVPAVPLRREVLVPAVASRPRGSARWSAAAVWLAVVVPSVVYAWFWL